MATINTNMSANIASNALTRNERSMAATMERLSTGIRINSAKDDAAGLAISSKMTSQINGLKQAVRNANDAISMIQVAEGAMKEVTNMFQRMRELAVQAISDSNTSDDRKALNNEYKELSAEVARIAENTQWNGTNILDGDMSAVKFQVGANAGQDIQVDFGDLGDSDIGLTSNTVTSTADSAGTSVLVFTGTFKEGDTISYKVDDTNYGHIILTADDAAALNDGGTTDTTDNGNNADGLLPNTFAETSTTTPVIGSTANQSSNAAVAATVTGVKTITLTGPTVGTGTTFNVSDVTVSRGTHALVQGTDITDATQAETALGRLDEAIVSVNDTRAGLGASMSRLEFASDNLQNVAQNSAAARSRVMDADYAAETTNLARTQIIQQAATAMLAQANQSQQVVLSLLK
jgi:flagellin